MSVLDHTFEDKLASETIFFDKLLSDKKYVYFGRQPFKALRKIVKEERKWLREPMGTHGNWADGTECSGIHQLAITSGLLAYHRHTDDRHYLITKKTSAPRSLLILYAYTLPTRISSSTIASLGDGHKRSKSDLVSSGSAPMP